MQATPNSEGTLPHQESKRIIEDLFPVQARIDDFQDAEDTVPGAVANNGYASAVIGSIQHGASGTLDKEPVEQGSSDTLRDDRRPIIIPGEDDDVYDGSSDTIRDEESNDAMAEEGAPLGRNSNATIGDGEKQDRGAQQNNALDRRSSNTSDDLEKGETDSQEHDQVNQTGDDTSQTQWKNNVVGWDGPNDPQNPHNWKKSKKYTVTVFYSSMTFCITFASSVFSTATVVTAKMYGVSNEVMTLGTSLFVFVSAHPKHHPHPALTKIPGFRPRPNNMGSPLRTLRSQVSSLLRVLRLYHLSNPCCCSPKHRNNHALSIPRWLFRVGTIGDNRGNTGRLLGPCRERFRSWPVLGRDIHWACGGTHRGGLPH